LDPRGGNKLPGGPVELNLCERGISRNRTAARSAKPRKIFLCENIYYHVFIVFSFFGIKQNGSTTPYYKGEVVMRTQVVLKFVGVVFAVCRFALAGAAVGVLPLACTNAPAAPSTLSVVTWNVEALFDGRDDGSEYAEYREAQGWSEEKFRSRLTAIAKAFDQFALVDQFSLVDQFDHVAQTKAGPPDVAVFIELENERVLNLLAEEYLVQFGYHQGYFAKRDGQSLGIGVLSRYPITKALSHGYSRDGKSIPRPVSEVWVEAAGEEIVILVCHWKSKLGNPAASLALRNDAAALVRRISEDIRAERESEGKAAVPILLAGDFNQTAAEFFAEGFPFPVTGNREDFHQSRQTLDAPLFWTPWDSELDGGSYYYKGEWESIDHFFLSGAFFDGRAWDYGGIKALKGAPWTGANGIPQSFNPRTGSGLSDHLPLLLMLSLCEE
jgi:hypothetical protein